ADLRYFSRRRRGVKSEWNSQFLQGRPYRIEITRVPGHVAQRFGSSEDADKAQFANSALRFLDRFIGIVERDHPDTLQALWLCLEKMEKPVIIATCHGGRKLGANIAAHHNPQADGRIERRHIQAFPIHRFKLRLGVKTLRAIVGDLLIDASSIK